ncbi:hypothetical protein HYS54_04450 [Candidatus Micrarchaeota archaeon]|nr:hypothetical protein [Candidatus Micrarchaeota archaeon]
MHWIEVIGATAAMVSVYISLKAGLPLDDLILIVIVSALFVSLGTKGTTISPVPA